MDFDLSKPQKLLKDSAREFLARECKPEKARELMSSGTAHDEKLWKTIADQGWTGLTIAEDYGGLGLGFVELAAVAEEMGRACLPGVFLSNLFASALVEYAGNDAQKKKYLEPIALGEMKATVAFLEASASWDLDGIRLEAKRGDGNYTVSGKKLFVADAETADLIICVAREGENFALLPVERNAENLSVKSMPSMDATRKLYEVNFDGVNVAGADVLGADGDARGALKAAIDAVTVALCAEMVGGMQWVLEASVEYAKTRQQFGKPIGAFQAVQHQCADMVLMTESARSAAYYAAWTLTEKDAAAPAAISIAKAYCSDAFREVANRGVQIHGGIGFTWEHDLQLYYKRSKASETMFGDATFHREKLAKIIIDDSKQMLKIESREINEQLAAAEMDAAVDVTVNAIASE